jgi:NAD(P)H-hydrate epimerase
MSEFLKETDVAKLLPKRDDNGNKGSFGTLLSVCGSEFMTGAAFFSSSAALKTGIGLLKLASPRSALKPLQSALFEPVFAPLSEKNGFISKKSNRRSGSP